MISLLQPAIASYNAVHDTDFKTSDVTQIHASDLGLAGELSKSDIEDYIYILTYSFPCTDISNAGKMQGYSEEAGTRSSLLWQVKRILEECDLMPNVLVMENVTGVHGKGENEENFNKWLSFLESLGYCNYWQDMNAADYGIPQSRKRCFLVSMLLGEHNEMKFEEPYPLNKTVRDYLEKSVDDKFYLSNEKTRSLVDNLIQNGKIEDAI